MEIVAFTAFRQTLVPLLQALDELSALAGDEYPDQAETKGRAQAGRPAAAGLRSPGEAKRGKSTLVNALLAKPLLPTGVIPVTALATTVRHGTGDHVTALYRDGREESCPLSALETW